MIIAVVTARPLADELGEFWTDCSSSTDIGKISNIVFNPDPPKKGESLNVVANFTLIGCYVIIVCCSKTVFIVF
jgi:hypothetical protein